MRRKMRSLLVIVFGAVVFAYVFLPLGAKPIPNHPFFKSDDVLVMAHRGGLGLWPENTLYAFEHAVQLGVDVLEMDVHTTADGTLVVMHDETVDRTTDGAGPITGFTLTELKMLDAGYRWSSDNGQSFPFRGQGLTIPTLAEVFVAFPDSLMNIEIKQYQLPGVSTLCRMIRQHGMAGQVVVASSDAGTMEAFRRMCSEVATSASSREVLLFYGLNLLRLESSYSPSAEALQVPEGYSSLRVVRQRFVSAAHERNMEVHVWTVNDTEDMQRLLDWGVDGIITDYPDRLLALLGR
jgi:glycerophosphoryl diester phosphodiesterase